MEQQLQLVNFEQAKRLKKLGFDWETDNHYYDLSGTHRKIIHSTKMFEFISAPTVALALKWARDVKEIMNGVYFSNAGEWIGFIKKNEYQDRTKRYNTYELAESELLNEILTILETNKI